HKHAVAEVGVSKPVMWFAVSEVISHLERRVRHQFLLALGGVGRSHMETGSGKHRLEATRALAWSFGASGDDPTEQHYNNSETPHSSFIYGACSRAATSRRPARGPQPYREIERIVESSG